MTEKNTDGDVPLALDTPRVFQRWKVWMALLAAPGLFLQSLRSIDTTIAGAIGYGIGGAVAVAFWIVFFTLTWRGAVHEWRWSLPVSDTTYANICLFSAVIGAVGGLFGQSAAFFGGTYMVLILIATVVSTFREAGRGIQES